MNFDKRAKLFSFSVIFVFLFFVPESLSAGLSDYPEFLLNDIYTVVGAEASVLPLAAATDIVANIKSEYPAADVETALDTELVNPYTVYRNLILVGNPCNNKFVAMIMDKEFPSCGTESGIPENSAIIKIYEDGFVQGYDVLLVAGRNGTYTRIAASVLQKHDQLLSGISEDAIKVTSATSSGITPLFDEEPTTSSTTTIIATITTPGICYCPDYCEDGNAWQGECQWSSVMGKYVCVYHSVNCQDKNCIISDDIAMCPTVITTSTTVSNTFTSSTKTSTTTTPSKNGIGIPESFYIYSIILIVLIVGISSIVIIFTRKGKLPG